jgi:hypothetical protein
MNEKLNGAIGPKETPKITIRSCMETEIQNLKGHLRSGQSVTFDIIDILNTAASLRHLNARAEKAAQRLCWEQSSQRDKFWVAALDSEV